MGFFCDDREEYVEAYECRQCDETDCEHHPKYKDPKKLERLEKFKSSKFAQDCLKQMGKVFPLNEVQIANRLEELFKVLQSGSDDMVEGLVEKAIKARAAKYVDEKMGAVLDELFIKAVDEQIVLIQKDDQALMTSIRQQAAEMINTFMANQGRDRNKTCYAEKTIAATIENIVSERVNEAIKELTAEAIETFNKEAMKKMMSGMAKALGADAKIARLLTEPL